MSGNPSAPPKASLQALLLGIMAIVALIGFSTFTPEFATQLIFGWIHFVGSVVFRIRVRWDGIAIFIALYALSVACLHYLLVWLISALNSKRSVAIRWRLRSSIALVSMLLMVFAIGICVTGVVHQTLWIISAPESLYTSDVQSIADSERSQYRPFELENASGFNWITSTFPFLPYIYPDIDRSKSWNAPENEKDFKKYLPIVICPSHSNPKRSPDGFALSHIEANSSIVRNPKLRYSDLSDPARTIYAGEVNAAYTPWGSHRGVRSPSLGIRESWEGAKRGQVGFGSAHPNGANFVNADASVYFISDTVDKRVLEAMGKIKKE